MNDAPREGRAKTTLRVVVHLAPDRATCLICEGDRVVASIPDHFTGGSAEEALCALSSSMRYWSERAQDNEYPVVVEAQWPPGAEEPELRRAGLLVEYAEDYGRWNEEAGRLDRVPKRCDTCRWWVPDPEGPSHRKFGLCNIATTAPLVNTLPVARDEDARCSSKAHATDGAQLFTMADFGCVQWEANPDGG